MKNPRISNHRIPKQRVVGRRVAAAIDTFLDIRPIVQEKVMRSIGGEVDERRKYVEKAPNVRRPMTRSARTELCDYIFQA